MRGGESGLLTLRPGGEGVRAGDVLGAVGAVGETVCAVGRWSLEGTVRTAEVVVDAIRRG